jgi:hypothetical protein
MMKIYQNLANFSDSYPSWLLDSTTSDPAFFSRPLDLNHGPYRYHGVQVLLCAEISQAPGPSQLSQKLPASPMLGWSRHVAPHARPCPPPRARPRPGATRALRCLA